MHAYTHTLTDIEVACGITLEDVARELPRGEGRIWGWITFGNLDVR